MENVNNRFVQIQDSSNGGTNRHLSCYETYSVMISLIVHVQSNKWLDKNYLNVYFDLTVCII